MHLNLYYKFKAAGSENGNFLVSGHLEKLAKVKVIYIIFTASWEVKTISELRNSVYWHLFFVKYIFHLVLYLNHIEIFSHILYDLILHNLNIHFKLSKDRFPCAPSNCFPKRCMMLSRRSISIVSTLYISNWCRYDHVTLLDSQQLSLNNWGHWASIIEVPV